MRPAEIGGRWTSIPQAGPDGQNRDADFAGVLRTVTSNKARAPSASGNGGGSYRIRNGDTLYRITKTHLLASGQIASPQAIRQGMAEIAHANQIADWNRIYAGRTLKLASAAPPYREPLTAAKMLDAAPVAPPHDAEAPTPGTDPMAVPYTPGFQTQAPPEESQESREPTGLIGPNDSSSAEVSSTHPQGLRLYQQSLAATPDRPPAGVADVAYKGVVGKLLDAVPLENSTRTALQQANAVASNSFAGRSLATMIGLSNPLFAIAGFFWGLFAASQISSANAAEPQSNAQAPAPARVD